MRLFGKNVGLMGYAVHIAMGFRSLNKVAIPLSLHARNIFASHVSAFLMTLPEQCLPDIISHLRFGYCAFISWD